MRSVLLLPLLALVGCSFLGGEGPEVERTPVPTPVHVSAVVCPPAPAYCTGAYVAMEAGYYGCHNFAIDHDVEVRGTAVRATLKSVSIGEICLTALGPATGRIALDVDRLPETVEFALGGDVDRYALRRQADTLALVPLDTSFTTPRPARR